MKQFFLYLLLVFAISTDAQDIIGNSIVLGHTDTVQSKILNEKRSIWIHLPAGANNPGNAGMRYPVVYVLDGSDHFASVSGIIQYLSEANGNMICPDMIVVGINNTDRTRDLTPTNGKVDFENKPTTDFKTSGGGEAFTAFIEKELMPYIESKYPAAPFRMLVGHSLGGLTAVNILINHTALFNTFIIVDPSMWWDHYRLLKQAHEVLKSKDFTGKSVFLGIANTMPVGDDTAHAHRDTSSKTNHIRSILNLVDEFKSNPGNGLIFSYKYYNDDSHNSAPLITEYDALRFLFGFYRLPPNIEALLFDKNDKSDVGAILEQHYANVSKRMGYRLPPSESILDAMGHDYLGVNWPVKALSVFNLNAKLYPNSPVVYASLGEYYNLNKDKQKAIDYYKKSLSIKNDAAVKAALDKIINQK